MRGVNGVVDRISRYSPENLAVSSITRYELRFGAIRCAETRRQRELGKVERFLSMLHEIAFDEESANLASEIRKDLERKGTPIGPMDLLIAATAMAKNLTLVSGNVKEFSRIADLKLESLQSGG